MYLVIAESKIETHLSLQTVFKLQIFMEVFLNVLIFISHEMFTSASNIMFIELKIVITVNTEKHMNYIEL